MISFRASLIVGSHCHVRVTVHPSSQPPVLLPDVPAWAHLAASVVGKNPLLRGPHLAWKRLMPYYYEVLACFLPQ